MNRIFRRILGTAVPVLLLLATLAVPAAAQVTLNSTTLTANINSTITSFRLVAVTNIAVGDWLFMDAEAMQVNSIDTTALLVGVRRGIQGTAGRAHAAGVIVWTGGATRFSLGEVAGVCTATAEEFLPRIVLPSANVYMCSNSEWVQYRGNGTRDFSSGRSDGGTSYAASGAIVVQPGLSLLTAAGVGVYTLVAPTLEQNGMVMYIYSTTAQAHTITVTAGFGPAGGAARDLGTFAAAIGNGLTIVASNGLWVIVQNTGVTLS